MVSVLLIPLIPAPLFSTSPGNKRTSPFIPFSTINFEFLLCFIFSLGAEENLLVKLSLLNLVHALARADNLVPRAFPLIFSGKSPGDEVGEQKEFFSNQDSAVD